VEIINDQGADVKKLAIALSFFFCLGFAVVPSQVVAGTYFTGVKGWYASWDSAILDWFEEDLANTFLQSAGLTLVSDKDPGEGHLVGPMFGYLTDDGKWSFSFSPMIISDFEQDWYGMAGPMTVQSHIDLDRQDYDLAASMKLNGNYKLYFGYKYQDMSMDFTYTYDVGGVPTTFNDTIDSKVHIPTIGIGGVYQFSNSLVGGAQVGLLYTFPELEITTAGVTTDIRPWNSFGFNVELNLTYRPAPGVLVQGGYRYQAFEFEARAHGFFIYIDSYYITLGLTISAFYVF
jgi:opacity protein-like surface antigen